MRKIKDLEFAVDDPGGRQKTFDTFAEAVVFAVSIACSTGSNVNIDVLISSKTAARMWGGDDAVEQYNDDPNASVSERIVIRAESVGRIA